MTAYVFWNNKGGTGKTSLAFQAIVRYAELHPERRVLAIDACPQANLSELLLGGLVNSGSTSLLNLHAENPRRSIGGYFQDRLPSPFSAPSISASSYISVPSQYNQAIPSNVELVAGDPIVELQANAVATLANTQIPGQNTWVTIIDWLRDLISSYASKYDDVFIDTNPSFSVYTQMALATSERLVLPATADDSSRRAIQNAFSLVYGLQLPSPIYSQHAFSTRLQAAGRALPKVHLIARNRITQYMGEASAYAAVLRSIDGIVQTLLAATPYMFTFQEVTDGVVSIRDFQTTGVVAFALGLPFSRVESGKSVIQGQEVSVKQEYLKNCRDAIDLLVSRL